MIQKWTMERPCVKNPFYDQPVIAKGLGFCPARHCEEAEGRRGNPEATREAFWIASLRSQ
jgi:hypothetical protein